MGFKSGEGTDGAETSEDVEGPDGFVGIAGVESVADTEGALGDIAGMLGRRTSTALELGRMGGALTAGAAGLGVAGALVGTEGRSAPGVEDPLRVGAEGVPMLEVVEGALTSGVEGAPLTSGSGGIEGTASRRGRLDGAFASGAPGALTGTDGMLVLGVGALTSGAAGVLASDGDGTLMLGMEGATTGAEGMLVIASDGALSAPVLTLGTVTGVVALGALVLGVAIVPMDAEGVSDRTGTNGEGVPAEGSVGALLEGTAGGLAEGTVSVMVGAL